MAGIVQAFRNLSRPSAPGKWQRTRRTSLVLAIIAMLLLIVCLVLGFNDLAASTALLSAMAGGFSLRARAEMRASIHGVFE